MTGKSAKGSSVRRWSAIKSIGFAVNAALEEKPDVRDESQESNSKSTHNQPNLETVADSNVIGGVQKFDSDRDMKMQITAMNKTEADEFSEMMNRCIARWDKGKNLENAELRSEAFMEIANSELEDNATFSDDGFSDDNSFFHSDDENKFHCMDDNVFLPNNL